MAAPDLASSFQDEVTCSLCLDYFKDPVTIDCGHNFCQACIIQCWRKSELNFSCPQCRETAQQRKLRPNRLLGNMVELVKQLRQQAGKAPKGQRVCEGHREALKLFCQEDEAPICVVCDRSWAHRAHTVVPLEEAAQVYKEKILRCLQHLRGQREELQGLKTEWQQESEWLLKQTKMERQLGVSECKELRQLLVKHENLLLALLEDLDTEIVKKRDKNTARLCEETALLSTLITELEGKCQQPAHELLQGVRSMVSRYVWAPSHLLCPLDQCQMADIPPCTPAVGQSPLGIEHPPTPQLWGCCCCCHSVTQPVQGLPHSPGLNKFLPAGSSNLWCRAEKVTSLQLAPKFPELEKRIRDFPKENKLQECLTGFLEQLVAERGFRRARGHAVDVTLDPDTAHPELILSEDRKSVRHGNNRQILPNNPERFNSSRCVLGSKRFTGGRHYWEVEVGDKTRWTLGVCRESVCRKGAVSLLPEAGYWTAWLRDGKYTALTFPTTPLHVRVRPRRVGVFLDYEGGKISFYNVTGRSHLFTVTQFFTGTLRPYFGPGLQERGTNAGPLIICPVLAQP
ncbi:zinc finger protein RFP [Alligator mississippiensis]|uniref:zinc finger protein RFP n=1 Tax=Alligator mississippiensis TaxID=8496 RepID=UPI002877D93D|nr:zinc finger protein RFP [Alligator mississippiensis]